MLFVHLRGVSTCWPFLHRYIFIKPFNWNTFQGYQSGQSPPSPRPSPQQLQILKLLSQHMGDKAQQNMMQQNHVSFQLKLFLLLFRPSSNELFKVNATTN